MHRIMGERPRNLRGRLMGLFCVWGVAWIMGAALLPQTVFAQNTISGKVTEADGTTPIAGAAIDVYENATGVGAPATSTNSSGDYSIDVGQPAGTGPAFALMGISTRAYVETGAGIAIAGFYIQGNDPMTVLIRTTAPGLADSGLSDVLSNPSTQLYAGGTLIARNADWQTTDPLCGAPAIACGNAQAIINTGLNPCVVTSTGCNLESAILATLPPGGYGVFLLGAGSDPTGIGLISVIDVDTASTSELTNVSTRVTVGLGERVTIAQFVIQGDDLTTVLISTRGPGLASFGHSDVLPNPSLQLYSGQTLVARNDDWQSTDPLCTGPAIACGGAQEIINTGMDPCVGNYANCASESSVLVTLSPGTYTAHMRGVGADPTGLGLIMVNDLGFRSSVGDLQPGTYTVQAAAAGYVAQSRTGITAFGGTPVDFSLYPASDVNDGSLSTNSWSPTVCWVDCNPTIGFTAIHLSLLPNGNLLALGPQQTYKMTPTPLGEPLPAAATVTNMTSLVPYKQAGDSLYCSGHTLLRDGVFFTAGGISAGVGLPYALTYDDDLGVWSRMQNEMTGLGDTPSVGPRRWYPAVTRLANSRILVTAGRDQWAGFSSENRNVEIFDPGSGTWSLVSSHANSPEEIFNFNYSHVFQLPSLIENSDVIMFGEDGYPVLFSTSTGNWQVRGGSHRPPGPPQEAVKSNVGASSLILPIRVNDGEWGYSNGTILMAGGSYGTDYEKSVDIYDPIQDTWTERDMGVRRHHPSTVLLPDGRILIVAGNSIGTDPGAIQPGYAQYIDPANNFQIYWSQSVSNETRGYHTVTLLLPDGRVLVGGGNDNDAAGNEKKNFRYFYPDYFNGPRPEVTSFPAQFDYDSSHTVTWQNAASVSEVALMAMGSMTHSIDFSQRHIQLQIQTSAAGSTTFLAPPNSMVAPPGFYLLFVLDQNRRPSIGKIIQLGHSNPPSLNPIGAKTVNEGALLSFTVSGSDPDGDLLTYSASGLPAGAGFNPSTRTFSWMPDPSQAGQYSVNFMVSDGSLAASESVPITVNNAMNGAPVLNPIGAKTVNEGALLSFTVSGSDPDGDLLTYSASGLPAGAVFNPDSRTFSWIPAVNQAGSYTATFTVTDGALSDSETITMTVTSSLAAWYRMDDTTTTITDASGRGNTGYLWNSTNVASAQTGTSGAAYLLTSNNHRQGQTFTAATPIRGVGISAPSWSNNIGTLVVTLYTSTARTSIVASQAFVNYIDNDWLDLSFAVRPAGVYYLEWYTTNYTQWVGAWGRTSSSTNYTGGTAYSYTLPRTPSTTGSAVAYDFSVRWAEGVLTTLSAGQIGNALAFDGVDDYVRVADHNSLDPVAITIEAWIYRQVDQTGTIVSKGYGNEGYRIQVNQISGAIQWITKNSAVVLTSAGTVPLQQWTHVAVTGDATGHKIYIRGAVDPNGTPTVYAAPNTTDTLTIGTEDASPAFTSYFNGRIDEVKIFNRALTPTEVCAEAGRSWNGTSCQ